MSSYGIKVIDHAWEDSETLTFNAAAYNQWNEEIRSGTRILLYRAAPIDAIIAEVEVTGDFITEDGDEIANEFIVPGVARPEPTAQVGIVPPQTPQNSPRQNTLYRLPVNVLRSNSEFRMIPQAVVRMHSNQYEFPRVEEDYLPLSEEQYHAIAGEWQPA